MKMFFRAHVIAVGLALFMLAPFAQAIVYDYTFSGATYAGNGDSANLSGTFSWDTTLNSVTTSNIVLTGVSSTGAAQGPVSCSPNCSTGIHDGGGRYFAIFTGNQTLYITFQDSLSLGVSTPLSLSTYGGANQAQFQSGMTFTSVTGTAHLGPLPEAKGVPTLSQWGMLALSCLMVLASLLVLRRRKD